MSVGNTRSFIVHSDWWRSYGALALGTALLFRFWLANDGGPTAATLSEGFSLLDGAATGLAVGSALVSLAARTGPRTLTGAIAGLLGYGITSGF